MNDTERRLRELSARALEQVPALVPNDRVLRRIRFRRGVTALAVAMSILVVSAGGVYASANLFGDELGTRPRPAASGGDPCFPVPFEPTYLPRGISAENRSAKASGGSWFLAPVAGRFIRIEPFPIPGIARVDREQFSALGSPAEIANIHEGSIASFSYRGCHYDAEAHGITRGQLRRFVEGLTGIGGNLTFEQVYPSETGAIWPEDTREAAARACSTYQDWRADKVSLALEFADQVLGWSPQAFETDGPEGEVVLRQSGGDTSGFHGVVHVYTTELSPACWSVSSVSRPPDRRPTGVSVQIQGRTARIGFTPFGAASARVEVGYGGRNRHTIWQPTDEGPATIRLDFEPDTDGHFLVLLRDERGRVFSATGSPLPPGDFSAG